MFSSTKVPFSIDYTHCGNSIHTRPGSCFSCSSYANPSVQSSPPSSSLKAGVSGALKVYMFRCLYKVQQTLPSLTSFPVESASARYLMNPNSSSVSGFRVYVKALRFILPSNTDISVSHFKGHFWRICFCDASYKCPLPATSWEWAPSSDALFGRCCLLSRMCSLSISSDLNYWWNESIRLPSVRHDLGSRLLSLNSWINSSGMRLLNLILAAAAPVSAKRRTPSPTYN